VNDFQFSVVDAEAKAHAASPTIRFKLAIRCQGAAVEAIVLRTQIRIEPQWRSYDAAEQDLLVDLFGTPDRWNTTLHALAWADVPVMVPAFDRETEVDVAVACTYDFDVAATRFFNAVAGGEIPLRFLFSGSIFRRSEESFLVEMLSWSSECGYRMPWRVWRSAMNACYGDSALLRVDREMFVQLQRVRAKIGAHSWEQTFAHLLADDRKLSRSTLT
jgi:Family of unknown function (DUF6084)